MQRLPPQIQRLLQFTPTEKEIQFFTWACSAASSTGAFNPGSFFLHDRLRLRKTQALGYDFCISRDENTPEGQVIKTSSPAIRTDDVILRVPASLWRPYSADHALLEFERLSPDVFKALLTLSQRVLPGADTKTVETFLKSFSLAAYSAAFAQDGVSHPYLAMLREQSYPDDNERLPHTLLMDKGTYLDPYLQNTRVYRDIMMRKNMYEYLSSTLLDEGGENKTAGSEKSEGVQAFLWGMSTVLSRALSKPATTPMGLDFMPFTMVPLLDFANHGDQSPGLVKRDERSLVNARHHYDANTHSFSLLAERDLWSGESVRISYGKTRDSPSFVTLYGMLGDYDNANDTLRLTLFDSKTGKAIAFQSLRDSDAHSRFKRALVTIVEGGLSIDGNETNRDWINDLIDKKISIQGGNVTILAPIIPEALRNKNVILALLDGDEEKDYENARDKQEVTAQLLAWTLKTARLFEKDERDLLQKLQGVDSRKIAREISHTYLNDWIEVRNSLDETLKRVYLSSEKLKSFDFIDKSNGKESIDTIGHEFMDHLNKIAVRIKPNGNSDSEDVQLGNNGKGLSAIQYWKCCCARILERELKELLFVRNIVW